MGLFRIRFLAAVFPTLIGCVSLDSAPKKEKLAEFESAYIVPLEDTPLGIDPTFKYVIPAAGLPAAQIAGVFNVVSALVQLPDALKRSEAVAKALQQDMSAKSPWQPTLKLSEDAAALLKRNGIPVTVASAPFRLKDDTEKAINDWYNNDKATANYSGLASTQFPYVLEILQSSHVFSNSLMVYVRIKLIDPATGTVIGRTRTYELEDLPAMEDAFKDNGQIYKEIFLATGHELVQESLDDLGLIGE